MITRAIYCANAVYFFDANKPPFYVMAEPATTPEDEARWRLRIRLTESESSRVLVEEHKRIIDRLCKDLAAWISMDFRSERGVKNSRSYSVDDVLRRLRNKTYSR